MTLLARRDLLLASASVLLTACTRPVSASPAAHPASPPPAAKDAHPDIARIEASLGGRIGVFAMDETSGRTLAHRADERFAMCSTFKWTLAAAAFARVGQFQGQLDDRIAFGPADVLDVSPVTQAHAVEGRMTVEELVRAAVTVSDNTAANLLLAWVGGPAALTAFYRQMGDTVTRLDRNEPTLNASNAVGDDRDTTSPRAMVGLMDTLLVGNALEERLRDKLVGLMRDCQTGKKRLRAGLPADWVVGDKTGTGDAAFNDVAIATPPGRAPVLIAAYMSDPDGPEDPQNARHEAAQAAIAEVVASAFAG